MSNIDFISASLGKLAMPLLRASLLHMEFNFTQAREKIHPDMAIVSIEFAAEIDMLRQWLRHAGFSANNRDLTSLQCLQIPDNPLFYNTFVQKHVQSILNDIQSIHDNFCQRIDKYVNNGLLAYSSYQRKEYDAEEADSNWSYPSKRARQAAEATLSNSLPQKADLKLLRRLVIDVREARRVLDNLYPIADQHTLNRESRILIINFLEYAKISSTAETIEEFSENTELRSLVGSLRIKSIIDNSNASWTQLAPISIEQLDTLLKRTNCSVQKSHSCYNESLRIEYWKIQKSYSGAYTGVITEKIDTSSLAQGLVANGVNSHDLKLAIYAKLQKMVFLMNQAGKHPDFRLLKAITFIEKSANQGTTVYYEMPQWSIQRKPPTVLAELLRKDNVLSSASWKDQPSASVRLKISQVLVTGLLAMHSVNWMCKEIKAENVVFFYRHSNVAGDYIDLTEPFFIGLLPSRQQEDASIAYNPMRTYTEDFDSQYYQHPIYLLYKAYGLELSNYKLRESDKFYKFRYDYYALGILLLEIGLWQSNQCFKLWWPSTEYLGNTTSSYPTMRYPKMREIWSQKVDAAIATNLTLPKPCNALAKEEQARLTEDQEPYKWETFSADMVELVAIATGDHDTFSRDRTRPPSPDGESDSIFVSPDHFVASLVSTIQMGHLESLAPLVQYPRKYPSLTALCLEQWIEVYKIELFRLSAIKYARDYLGFAMGEKYKAATLKCLTLDFEVEQRSQEEDWRDKFNWLIVKELDTCHI